MKQYCNKMLAYRDYRYLNSYNLIKNLSKKLNLKFNTILLDVFLFK